jgi:hypothetical protein
MPLKYNLGILGTQVGGFSLDEFIDNPTYNEDYRNWAKQQGYSTESGPGRYAAEQVEIDADRDSAGDNPGSWHDSRTRMLYRDLPTPPPQPPVAAAAPEPKADPGPPQEPPTPRKLPEADYQAKRFDINKDTSLWNDKVAGGDSGSGSGSSFSSFARGGDRAGDSSYSSGSGGVGYGSDPGAGGDRNSERRYRNRGARRFAGSDAFRSALAGLAD